MSKKQITEQKGSAIKSFHPYTTLDFKNVELLAKKLGNYIESNLEKIVNILLTYESYEVARDEIQRTLDLLYNIRENKAYFQLRVGAVTSFLPRNQPLYAFACFVVIPSLMSNEVHFRIPHSMRHFFSKLIKIINIKNLFPNIFVSHKTRLEFLRARSALYIDKKNEKTKPVTDVVIFTGTPTHADQLRSIFDKQTLFISNGSGHNPVVISSDANIGDAVEAVMQLQFYNQGQDCAAPNAILVHKDIFNGFLDTLREKMKNLKVGNYHDRSCRVGPISDPEDLVRIQSFLIENREWIDQTTPGTIKAKKAIVEPTIVCKPLSKDGNYSEIFAPIVFVQKYTSDNELKKYFDNVHYIKNAMYISIYGKSKYINSLINKPLGKKIMHTQSTILHNTHLHAPGVERGVHEYGGYGYGASSISINGKIKAMPTLPQRDIFKFVAKPIIKKMKSGLFKNPNIKNLKLKIKDVEKLLKLQRKNISHEISTHKIHDLIYVDLDMLEKGKNRFIELEEKKFYRPLKERNDNYIAQLKSENIRWLHLLSQLLNKRSTTKMEQFKASLYNIAKHPDTSDNKNKESQFNFFRDVYQLLFAKNFGPKLWQFLWEVDLKLISKLLKIK
ncbi:MAG: aldehyde dehydrogenase family protein [Patescibacteria group bacterium]